MKATAEQRRQWLIDKLALHEAAHVVVRLLTGAPLPDGTQVEAPRVCGRPARQLCIGCVGDVHHRIGKDERRDLERYLAEFSGPIWRATRLLSVPGVSRGLVRAIEALASNITSAGRKGGLG